jgi:uncharacterized protein (TIGR02996 family)
MNPFVQAILAAPEDVVPRLIYADWLEEHGDARSELLRVSSVVLKDVPARLGPRPDCMPGWFLKKSLNGQHTYWAQHQVHVSILRLPPVPLGQRGLAGAGRLLGVCVLRDLLGRLRSFPGDRRKHFAYEPQMAILPSDSGKALQDKQTYWERLLRILAQYELYACRLITSQERDAGQATDFRNWPYSSGLVAGFAYGSVALRYLHQAFWLTRSGRFGRFINVIIACESVDYHLNPYTLSERGYVDPPELPSRPHHYTAEYAWVWAARRSHYLDLLERWQALCPWEAAWRYHVAHDKEKRHAWQQRPPEVPQALTRRQRRRQRK